MRINHMRQVVEQKQKEIDHINSKMQLPVDQDILRMRIQKDLESKYRFELDAKTLELDKVSENYFESKRMAELHKSNVEALKIENEKVVSDVKKRFQDEVSELVADNHALQLRIEDSTKDREQVRAMRRDLDDHKRRICDA